MRHFLYKLQFILLLQVFLFSFIATFEENSNISTDLIISAYFPKNHITRISYDLIKEEENKKLEKNINEINNKLNKKDKEIITLITNNTKEKKNLLEQNKSEIEKYKKEINENSILINDYKEQINL
jgi:deoxyhypusine synthase